MVIHIHHLKSLHLPLDDDIENVYCHIYTLCLSAKDLEYGTKILILLINRHFIYISTFSIHHE